MGINWGVRIKNPLWWVQIAVAIVAPILAYCGMQWGDVTSWAKLGELLVMAIQNPVILTSVLVSVYNATIDPTTEGVGDSKLAMTYDVPKKD